MTRPISTLVSTLALALAACGGGGDAPAPAAREAPTSTTQALAVMPRVEATELMDWAERSFPLFFAGRETNRTLAPFVYRFYERTGIYLGLDDDRIYVMGGPFGTSPLLVGTTGQFECLVRFAQCLAPTITRPPASVQARLGDLALFTVAVDGGPSLNFQWLRNGQPIAGATSARLELRVSEADRQARISVQVSNDKGTVVSESALIDLAPVVDIAAAVAVATREGCLACHAVNTRLIGPAFADVARKYAPLADGRTQIATRIRGGSSGAWGGNMPPNLGVSASEALLLADAILSLAPPPQ